MELKCARGLYQKCLALCTARTLLRLWSHPQQALGARRTLAPPLPAPASSPTRQQGRHEASWERPQVLIISSNVTGQQRIPEFFFLKYCSSAECV